jgi:hypothetical protein
MATRSAWISRLQKMITFCSGPPFAEQPEQILAHGGRAQLDEQLIVEILAGVLVLGQSASVSGLPVRISFTPAARISALVNLRLSMSALRLTISQAAR